MCGSYFLFRILHRGHQAVALTLFSRESTIIARVATPELVCMLCYSGGERKYSSNMRSPITQKIVQPQYGVAVDLANM
jgi:hypothetical protein